MQDELDPQTAPEGQADEPGQGEPEAKSPEAPPVVDVGQATQERLEKLEKSYTEAQRIIGRQGRELGELRKAAPRNQVQEEVIPPESFFTDPVNATTKVMTRVLDQYEARQEGKRQAERYLRSWSEANGMTESEILSWNDKFETSLSDPEARLELIREMHRSQNASSEIEKAARTAKDTVTRNARAVTAEADSTRVSPPGKSFNDMSGEEMREWIKRNHGEAENY